MEQPLEILPEAGPAASSPKELTLPIKVDGQPSPKKDKKETPELLMEDNIESLLLEVPAGNGTSVKFADIY